MSRRKCCCDRDYGCDIFSDNFNRADSDNLGSNWVEKVTDCDIASNKAQITSGGLCYVSGYSNPYDSHNAVVNILLYNAAAGDVFRVLLAYQNEDNYIYGEVECFDAGGGVIHGYLNLGQVVGGTETELLAGSDGIALPDGFEFFVCYGAETMFTIGYGMTTYNVCSDEVTIPDESANLDAGITKSTVGLASDGGTVDFDDFDWDAHFEDDRECPACACHCYKSASQFECPSDELLATIYNERNCSCSDLETFDMELSGEYHRESWVCSTPLTSCSSCADFDDYDFELVCNNSDSDDGDITTSYTMTSNLNTWEMGNSGKPRSTSTCNPFKLIFDVYPTSVSGGYPNACCDGQISEGDYRHLRIEVVNAP